MKKKVSVDCCRLLLCLERIRIIHHITLCQAMNWSNTTRFRDGHYRCTIWKSGDDFWCHPVWSANEWLALWQVRPHLCTEPKVR